MYENSIVTADSSMLRQEYICFIYIVRIIYFNLCNLGCLLKPVPNVPVSASAVIGTVAAAVFGIHSLRQLPMVTVFPNQLLQVLQPTRNTPRYALSGCSVCFCCANTV